MWRSAIAISAILVGLSAESSTASVESNYYEQIASRETGAYELDGTVYFHVSFGIEPAVDDSACRRRAMLAVQRLINEWLAKHAAGYETLPETIRKIDAFCSKYGVDASAAISGVHLSGRGFTVEADDKYAYGLAVPLTELNREARNGLPGRTEIDIVERWRMVCARELSGPNAKAFLADIGCGNIDSVPDDISDKIPAECAFLDDWDKGSQIVTMLKSTGQIDVRPEDLWMEGLSLVADLREGKVQLEDSGTRLYAALSETPGSAILWCYLGEHLKTRRLYRIAAVAYKNAFCLSSGIGLHAILKSTSASLAQVYRALQKDMLADGFELLSIGM